MSNDDEDGRSLWDLEAEAARFTEHVESTSRHPAGRNGPPYLGGLHPQTEIRRAGMHASPDLMARAWFWRIYLGSLILIAAVILWNVYR